MVFRTLGYLSRRISTGLPGPWCAGLLAFVALNAVLASSPVTPESHAAYTLNVSTSANRTTPKPLEGATVTGKIYVFTGPDTSVDRVRFYLDNPSMSGSPRQIENNAPYDFAGGTVSLANAFDTSKISQGIHTITAALELTNGQTAVVSTQFEVASTTSSSNEPSSSTTTDSGDSGGYTLQVSMSANRSSPQLLDGSAVTGAIYVFTKPDTSVDRVRFYLDDPTMSKSPRQTENNAPYDFAGGTASLANPFDTSKIPAGVHTITAALDLTDGRTEVVNGRFEVGSNKLVIGPSPIFITATAGQLATAQANLNSLGDTATVNVSDNASWLTVTSSSTTTPATLTLTVDARQLAQGKYSATVTATADGFTSASAPVTLEVGTEGQFALLVSASSNRATPAMLDGATVSGNIYAFVGPETGISRVRFWLDNPSMTGTPRQTESYAPWDFAGGSATSANPFDTRTVVDGTHSITAALDLSSGGTATIHTTFVVANSVSGPSPSPTPAPGSGTTVSLQGGRFYINGVVTHPGSQAEGLLMNGRMVNAVFEDEGRSFDAEANTDEFIAAMPDYVAHGMIAFTIGLQGGNPSYEGAINSAFRSDGSLKSTYMARVKRVIQAADSLGAVVILNLFYQRQDQQLANSDAVKAGVVNVMKWLTAEGFGNVMIDIVNEYNWSGFDHSILKTDSGVSSLIKLARSHAPHLLISASCAYVDPWPGVVSASDYILIHGNAVGDSALAKGIDALKTHGKPIIINEDPVENTSGRRAILSVQHGASWGLFFRKNQAYSFSFLGAADYPEAYQTLWGLTH